MGKPPPTNYSIPIQEHRGGTSTHDLCPITPPSQHTVGKCSTNVAKKMPLNGQNAQAGSVHLYEQHGKHGKAAHKLGTGHAA